MLLFIGWEAAHAGCAVDEDGERRRATAGLVLTGTVIRVEIAAENEESNETPYLRLKHHVQVDRTLEGHVASGFIVLDSYITGGFCPGDVVYTVGTRVYAIGTPTDGVSLPMSPCARDVGILTAENDAWLAGLPRTHHGGTYPGSAPVSPSALPEPLPKAGHSWIRLERETTIGASEATVTPRRPSHPVDGRVVSTHAGRTRALFDLEDMTLALWAGHEGLSRVLTTPVLLVGDADAGVWLRPGALATLTPADSGPWRASIDAAGLVATGPIDAAAVGYTWQTTPEPESLPLSLAVAAPLWASPAGGLLALLSPADELTLRPRGPANGVLMPVLVHTPWATAAGFIPAAAIAAGGTHGGIAGGVAGGSKLVLHPGVQLASLEREGSVIFGQVTNEHLATLLSQGKDEAFVVIDTPLGPFGARVSCRSPIGEEGCLPPQ